jgi:hypothetical protein
MSRVIHAKGMKLILTPDRQFDRQYLSQLAPLADIVVLQGQRIESNPQDFHNQLQPLISAAKAANPKIKVYVTVGTENGATVAVMQTALNTVSPGIDGIGVFSMPDQASRSTLKQFVSDIRK